MFKVYGPFYELLWLHLKSNYGKNSYHVWVLGSSDLQFFLFFIEQREQGHWKILFGNIGPSSQAENLIQMHPEAFHAIQYNDNLTPHPMPCIEKINSSPMLCIEKLTPRPMPCNENLTPRPMSCNEK